jgi:hypothetical protein
MERPHLRPRVRVQVTLGPDELLGVLDGRLRAMPTLEGRIRRRAVRVWIAPPHKRWWSPCLDLNVHPDGVGTRLEGWYTAHPRLMTATVFAGILFTFLACLSATWSLVQVQMGEPPKCLGGTLFAVAGLVGLWVANRLAQHRAQAQMHELAAFLRDLGAVDVDEAGAFSR